ncbi:PREDICTED: tumor protein p53-inducible nuclear protein 2-like [Priapulus caudatus]|uniref:Tumor protein p53-inducible nuclear protein 2-like n=1 Tax=Priapulus caudatus TaxID=37621 RepID=A0ABM1DYW7_PRICU|nr:PREDICTED: tumor protein p53-inducible nuclear protein 2-like [Priapulus caudatus]XP_014664994.1 PREDICTED: tumor protein p53-inducible nuclear protein 2-like [Priapulus caudatus]XP_014665067.1 PREDICTED: tumor protein p53-inducible nuclear protein 2-like [Priapulus caudatus]XP_014665138.1 PREDICTED: tumor protein p53-inducible nuclear protein 2-like [Priapulus caudatus]XP_014665209.1 PREDICTED: tumor protein p53-inducible nuclear protein 2-like [Priapulus caudatus]
MLGNIANIIFGTSAAEANHASDCHITTQEAEGWVLVDANQPNAKDGAEERIGGGGGGGGGSAQPDREQSSSTPSSDSGSSSFPGHVEEGWYVTPPPCFTGSRAGPVELETTTLENMLIEHPSMSVYGSMHSLRSQQCRAARDAEEEEEEEEEEEGDEEEETEEAEENSPPQCGAAQRGWIHHPRRPGVVHGAALNTIQEKQALLSMQKLETRDRYLQCRRSQLERSNKAREVHARGKRHRRKHYASNPSGRSNNRQSFRC